VAKKKSARKVGTETFPPGSDHPDLRGLPRRIGYVNTTHTVMAINRSLLLSNLVLNDFPQRFYFDES